MRIATPTHEDPLGGNAAFDALWRAGRCVVAYRNGRPVNRVVLVDTDRDFLLYYPVTPQARAKARKTGELPLKRLSGGISIEILPL